MSDWIDDLKGAAGSAFNAVGLGKALDENRMDNSHNVGDNLAKPGEDVTDRQKPVEAVHKGGIININRLFRHDR